MSGHFGYFTAGECGSHVASHAVVRCCIDSVGREVDFEHIVVLDAEILCGWLSDHGFGSCRQHDDAVVRRAYAYFVFGTNHAERFHTAYFRFLDFECLAFRCIEGCADSGYHYGLASGHVGRAADNLCGGACVVEVDGGDMQVVAVGMYVACEHFADNDAGKAAFDALYALHRAGLEANGRKEVRQGFGAEVEVNVFFEPFI